MRNYVDFDHLIADIHEVRNTRAADERAFLGATYFGKKWLRICFPEIDWDNVPVYEPNDGQTMAATVDDIRAAFDNIREAGDG